MRLDNYTPKYLAKRLLDPTVSKSIFAHAAFLMLPETMKSEGRIVPYERFVVAAVPLAWNKNLLLAAVNKTTYRTGKAFFDISRTPTPRLYLMFTFDKHIATVHAVTGAMWLSPAEAAEVWDARGHLLWDTLNASEDRESVDSLRWGVLGVKPSECLSFPAPRAEYLLGRPAVIEVSRGEEASPFVVHVTLKLPR